MSQIHISPVSPDPSSVAEEVVTTTTTAGATTTAAAGATAAATTTTTTTTITTTTTAAGAEPAFREPVATQFQGAERRIERLLSHAAVDLPGFPVPCMTA